MFDAIGQIFQGVIDFLSPIVLPEWKALVDLFPVFLLIGVVGPLLSLLVLGWVIYFIGKPRSRIPYTAPTAQPARIVDGRPVYPPGETRCAIDKRDLAVICPKCETGRPAYIDTCGTCGLVLKIDRAVPALRPAGPPPGGAAAA